MTPGSSDTGDAPEPSTRGHREKLAEPLDCPDTGAGEPQKTPPSGPACTKTAACKDFPLTKYCAVGHGVCVQCLADLHCASKGGTACVDFACQMVQCKAGETRCQDGFLGTCKDSGDGWELEACPEHAPVCHQGACKPCEPGALFCEEAGSDGGAPGRVMQCACDGESSQAIWRCEGAWSCTGSGCGLCVPGTRRCQGNVAQECGADGLGWQVANDCTELGRLCLAGSCVESCNADFKRNTNAGCDYWAVDLDNIAGSGDPETNDAQNAPFAVIISNTTDQPAGVVVSLDLPGGKRSSFLEVAPNGLQVLGLPLKEWKVANQNQDGSGINRRAYRIQSLQPIVAYQFNPLDNVNVYSNDASLLLPTNALGTTYRVLTYYGIGTEFRSYFTVIATEPGTTKVQVTPSVATIAGDGVPPLQPGATHTFSLTRGQVLNIESSETEADLTGSLVVADHNVAVLAGSELSLAPNHGNCVTQNGEKLCAGSSGSVNDKKKCNVDKDCPARCCGDHLEEQLFPSKAWGTTYVATAFAKRGVEKDVWRILALQDDTELELSPNPVGKLPVLAAGQVFDVVTGGDFIITASKPVQVGQIMASSYNVPVTVLGSCDSDATCQASAGYESVCASSFGKSKWCAPVGDPTLLMVVATSQYLQDYVFLVPDKYASNHVTLIKEPGTAMTLDGAAPPGSAFKQVSKSKWRVARLPVAPGTHRLKASKPVGLIVYGYDRDVSYGYAGGAGL